MKLHKFLTASVCSYLLLHIPVNAVPNNDTACANLPNNETLTSALREAVLEEQGGLNLHMWASLVNRDGIVCAVAYSGKDNQAQWPGSRVISAQKAYTANAFSLDASSSNEDSGSETGLALSTANLYSAVQPGGSLYGLQFSNPVDTAKAYQGNASDFGTARDPMVGFRIGGVNVFGGGLALYDSDKKIVGGLGVSGDTSCADHFIAWRLRNKLALDNLSQIKGINKDKTRPDNIIFDIKPGQNGGAAGSESGFGHPNCPNPKDPSTLPPAR